MNKIGYLKEIVIEKIGKIRPVNENERSGYKTENKICGRKKSQL